MPTQVTNTEIIRDCFIEPRRPGEKVWVTSNTVAELFDIRHDNILQAFRNLQCSQEFRLLNFQGSSYTNRQGREQPSIKMTRDGFIFLAMGFNGKKAAQFKELIIARFNILECYYLEREGSNRRSLEKLNRMTVDLMLKSGKTRAEIKRELVPTPQERDRDTIKDLCELYQIEEGYKWVR